MIIHRLQASGFKIMRDTIELQFPEEGRIGILGPNESGKTTLLEAIEYALYGLRRGGGIEESRENIVTWGKEEAELEIVFTSGQDRFLLHRVFGVGGRHNARLIPLINGNKDVSNALSSLTEIEAKIEQLTGMDRDSFRKLVYIRQKDLDALKSLGKAEREKLVNKVMGIEVFDDATSQVKSDLSIVTEDLGKKEIELGAVKKNAEAYETYLTQKRELEEEIRIYQDLLDKYKPEVDRFEGLRNPLLILENRLEQSQRELDSLKARENEAAIKTGLAEKERGLLNQNLSVKKQRLLGQFALMLVLSVALMAMGASLMQLTPILLGLLFGVLAIKFYLTYRKLDRILNATAEIQALRTQIRDETERIKQTREEIDSLTVQTGVKNHEDIDLALSSINRQIILATGQESIQGVDALNEGLQQKLGKAGQLDIELERLKKDYDLYPRVKTEYEGLQDKKIILDLVVRELGETSKDLRSKVIPYAILLINQVLPTLTDRRYSGFEISEDLKFKVYSNEAGGYKEREIFSGGTQDQFLIALRLAFTQSVLNLRVMADKYFILMDECISSSDEQRKQGIFEVLEAMKKTFSQLFIIAHEDVSNFVDHYVSLERNRPGYTQIRSKSW